jgi:YbgC/YbaW family acyl-CoA thioester hydrolase
MSSPPAPAPVSEHCLARRVHFYETDTAGIVHFSNYFRYLEEAEHAMWRTAGLSIIAATHKVGFPRVQASFDYKRPLRFADEFEIRLRVAAIGRTSMRYACTITRLGEIIATGTTTMVCVSQDGDVLRPVPFPADIVSRFAVTEPITP